MMFTPKPNRYAALWWISGVSLALGISIFILLQPGDYEQEVAQYRGTALVASVLISGLCIIIGTSKRWFGKGL
jgi:hypothetical protein